MSERAPDGPYVYQPHPVTRIDGHLWHVGGLPDGMTREEADAVVAVFKKREDRASMPTVDEIKKVLDDFNQAVDREDVLEGTVRAAVCTAMLERVLVAMLGLPPGSMRGQAVQP